MNSFKVISLVLLIFLFNCVNSFVGPEDECFGAITSYGYAEIDIINKSQNIKFIKFKSGNSFNINLYLLDSPKNRKDVVEKNTLNQNLLLEFTAEVSSIEKCSITKEIIEDKDKESFYKSRKNKNDYSSLDIVKSTPIKFYDANTNFIFQITNSLSKISNPQFDDDEQLIKGTITIDQSFIDDAFNGSKKED